MAFSSNINSLNTSKKKWLNKVPRIMLYWHNFPLKCFLRCSIYDLVKWTCLAHDCTLHLLVTTWSHSIWINFMLGNVWELCLVELQKHATNPINLRNLEKKTAWIIGKKNNNSGIVYASWFRSPLVGLQFSARPPCFNNTFSVISI